MRLLLSASLLAFALAACTGTTPVSPAVTEVPAPFLVPLAVELSGEPVAAGGLSLTPEGSSDYVATSGGVTTRYLTFTFSLRNATGRTLSNLVLRAYSPAAGIAGTAFTSLETASRQNVAPAVALDLKPTHAMRPGFLDPEVSPGGASLVAYSRAESGAAESLAREVGALGEGDTLLDYGFSVSAPGGVLADGGTGSLVISYRLPAMPRASAPLFIMASFLAVEDRRPSVLRSPEEGAGVAAVLQRAASRPGAVVVLLGTPSGEDLAAVRAAGREVAAVTAARTSAGGSVLP